MLTRIYAQITINLHCLLILINWITGTNWNENYLFYIKTDFRLLYSQTLCNLLKGMQLKAPDATIFQYLNMYERLGTAFKDFLVLLKFQTVSDCWVFHVQ